MVALHLWANLLQALGFFSTAKPSLWLKWPKCGSKHPSASAMVWTGKELTRVSFVLMVAVFDHLDELQCS